MASYDENFLENPFFKAVLKNSNFLNELIRQKRTLCVPCIGCYNTQHVFTTEDIETHAIVRDEGTKQQFRTYNNKVLSMVPKGFKTAANFADERVVKILFEETFFLDESRHIQVICIDSPFDSTTHRLPDTNLHCDTLQQCCQFLFDENTAWARAQLDDVLQKCVVSHKSAGMCLKQLISNTKATYHKCLDIVNREFHFPRSVLTNPNFSIMLELSVESYVMSFLHQTIFSELCYILGAKDAALNKTLRNLSLVKPSEVEDLNSVYFSSLPAAREKMSLLNQEHSPRDKMRLLCDCLMCLPTALDIGVAMSMDDLLPLLNYLIIKSEVPSWLANICYMQNFAFAQYKTDDRHDFCLVCFEASLEHIRNGSLNYLIAPANQSNLEVISMYDKMFSPAQVFRNCVLLNRCDDLTLILSSVSSPVKLSVATSQLIQSAMNDTSDTTLTLTSDDPLSHGSDDTDSPVAELPVEPLEKKCHPLCSCDTCEQNNLNVRWKDINVDSAFDGSGVSILHIAAQNSYTTMMDMLVDHGADVNAVDSAGHTALHLAAQRGAMPAVLLLTHHKAHANAVDNLGRTPLHELCERGHTDTLQALVYQKINLRVNAEANNGDTPLHLAARYGYGDIVSILLDVGASMSIRNRRGETALSTAQNKYIWHILQLFSSELELEQIRKSSVKTNLNEDQEKLFRLCAEGDLQMVKHKLKIKDFRSSSYNRPILRSIKQKCHPLCQCEKCFEIVKQSQISRAILCNSDRYTLLHIAALYGHSDLALLFSTHFNWMLDAVTSRHRLSPLHLACQYNNETIVDILITAGSDVNCKDTQNNTPLHFTCTNGHSGCAILLLEGGCDYTIGNERGDTPLHQAARWGHIPLVNLLLRFKAPVSIQNKNGLLPLHLSQFDEVCEALRRAMGLIATEQSEDDTIYTDCNSNISTPSPSTDRRKLAGSVITEKLKSLDLGQQRESCSELSGISDITPTGDQNSDNTSVSTSAVSTSAVSTSAVSTSAVSTTVSTSLDDKGVEVGTLPNMTSPEDDESKGSVEGISETGLDSDFRQRLDAVSTQLRPSSVDGGYPHIDENGVVGDNIEIGVDPLTGDEETGDEWVLQNRPLSFCED